MFWQVLGDESCPLLAALRVVDDLEREIASVLDELKQLMETP